jgi:flavin reductase (DIM6/NTAB) family NADH-FMN oxidoreductase RutF
LEWNALKVECDIEDVFDVTIRKLESGLLLTSVGSDGQYNVMTIGWGLVGRLWGEPVFMVAVRPSRHTFKLIEETNEFTVNVPSDGMDETVAYCGKAVAYCGKASGRDHDKIQERGLSLLSGKSVVSPMIESCVAHYECKVIGKSIVVPELLSSDVQRRSYRSGDYHTLYFGRILSILMNG